jgi:hypothetical protein
MAAKVVPILKNSVGPIESGVPLPVGNKHVRGIYPFPDMKVRDSFTVPLEKKMSAASAASIYGRRHKMRFTGRIDGDRYRIWRTK